MTPPTVNDLDRARERRRARASGPIGGFGGPARAVHAMGRAVVRMREAEARAGRLAPNPRRITLALDVCGLYGPEVDAACGVVEPAVDEWESGALVPTVEQVEALARLTGFPFSSFFMDDPAPVDAGQVFICAIDDAPTSPPSPRSPLPNGCC
jgi:hypothetical protein